MAHETIRHSASSQVIIVGAGPAGAATALLLARSGITVTLVERETDFHRVFHGEGLMPTGLDALYWPEMHERITHASSGFGYAPRRTNAFGSTMHKWVKRRDAYRGDKNNGA